MSTHIQWGIYGISHSFCYNTLTLSVGMGSVRGMQGLHNACWCPVTCVRWRIFSSYVVSVWLNAINKIQCTCCVYLWAQGSMQGVDIISGPNPCLSSPCPYNATCGIYFLQDSPYYYCICEDGNTGANCETRKCGCFLKLYGCASFPILVILNSLTH